MSVAVRTAPTGKPGEGCTDDRPVHQHRCGGCGRAKWFSTLQCSRLAVVPPCAVCRSTDWQPVPDRDDR